MDTISSLPVIPKHQLRLNLPQRHESGPQIRYVPVGAFQHTPECASVTDDPIRLARSRGASQAIDGLSSTCSPPALFHAQVPTLKQRLTDVNEPRRSQTFDVRKHAVNPVLFVRRWAQIRLPNDSPTAQITKKLRAARHRSYLRKYFVSEPDIRRIVSPEAVHQELARSNFSKLERIRKDPITIEDGGPYVKILAILYLIKKPTKIRLFVQSGVCDRDLPLEQDPRRDGPEGSYALRSRHNNQACTILFKRRDYAVDFLEHQWTVLAPTFVRNDAAVVPLVEIEPEVVLPFLSHQEVLKQGGSSKVFRTVIQPDHDLLGNTKFVTWYLGGYKLVEHFGQRRLANDLSMANIPTDTFFITYVESGVKQVKVKPAVIEVSLFSGLFVIDLPVILNRDMSTSDIDRAVCILITADQL
ncbi:unnamed protein product [Alternaria alternata]